ISVTDVDGYLGVARQDAGLVRPAYEPGNRRFALRGMVAPANIVDGNRNHCRAYQSVSALIHGRGSRMCGIAGDIDMHAVNGVAARHDAEWNAHALENWTLFNVDLEIRIERTLADRGSAGIADLAEVVAKCEALVVDLLQYELHGQATGERGRSHHGRLKSGALLVRPADNLQRSACCDAAIVQRPENFQAGQDAQNPVIAAARDLGIQMAADY